MKMDKTKLIIMLKLDEYQKDAVLEDGNVLLIAGAGAGKTFTITKKIEFLIENYNYKPEEILVISFTNKSVDDLKRKVKYNCDIMTFHKLALNILKDYNIEFNIINDDYLSYITNEYFQCLNDYYLINEILNFFHYCNYKTFLNSFDFKEFIKIIVTSIKIYKTKGNNIEIFNKLYKKDKFLSKYIYIIKNLYESELKSTGSMDFDDLIIKATDVLNDFYKYRYIIVDEFQDTSRIRFNLVNKLRVINNANLFAVGDDYQSIYHFSGCDLNIFLNFTSLIPNAKVKKLKYTYRNSQELIDISSKFVMKNKNQIKKELISNKHINNPIEIIYYINPKKAFKRLYQRLKAQNNDLLVLGRNNFDLKFYSNNADINYLTVHSSKGLEAENVILINLVNGIYGFPNKIVNNKLIEELNPVDKSIIYAEERRLFYVALTRTKNKVYLLVPFFNKSEFIKEIK